jgi:hypothetical protein
MLIFAHVEVYEKKGNDFRLQEFFKKSEEDENILSLEKVRMRTAHTRARTMAS